MSESADPVAVFAHYESRLLGIAYRMLGSMWDAEDVNARVRWLRVDHVSIREPAAFLTTVVTRLALDELRSARARRETYVGPWLPEPTITGAAVSDPLERVEQRASLSLATLRLMERLTPPERAVFVLREAFDVPYAQIAEILEISPGNARVLRNRARGRLAGDAERFTADTTTHAALLDQLLAALDSGDLQGLQDLLAADVVAYSDGGGKARAAIRPIVGQLNVMRFVAGLARRFAVDDVTLVEANGLPAATLVVGGQFQLLTLDAADGQIQRIYSIMNPDKLRWVRQQLDPRLPAG